MWQGGWVGRKMRRGDPPPASVFCFFLGPRTKSNWSQPRQYVLLVFWKGGGKRKGRREREDDARGDFITLRCNQHTPTKRKKNKQTAELIHTRPFIAHYFFSSIFPTHMPTYTLLLLLFFLLLVLGKLVHPPVLKRQGAQAAQRHVVLLPQPVVHLPVRKHALALARP